MASVPISPKSRFHPVESGRVRLTKRDIQLLNDLYRHRVMTRDQIIRLGYFQSVQRCNDRLRKLFDGRFVRRHFPVNGSYGAQAVYGLGPASKPVLICQADADSADVCDRVSRQVAPLFLDHTLAIVDFRIRLEEDVQASKCALDRWLPEFLCRHEYSVRQGSVWHSQVLKPDAYFRLKSASGMRSYFVEVDLGHVSLERFRRKIASYETYGKLGIFQETYGQDEFAVLTVTTTERRLQHLAQLVGAGSQRRFYFSTIVDFSLHGVLGRIWRNCDGVICLSEEKQ